MSITEIVNNLYMTEDKELFFKAYRLWCNMLYGKYGISDELLEVFIKDITKSNNILYENKIIFAESKTFKTVVINAELRTSTSFDEKLKEFINENS